VATDGSEAVDRALPHAKALAAEGGGPLTVVYCTEYTLPGKGGGSLPVHANEAEIQDKVNRQVAELSSNGAQATLHKARGQVGGAAHAIAELATEEHADVIVVGTRGHTALA
jgi:nucleotide-binding universal stress UspA family protein